MRNEDVVRIWLNGGTLNRQSVNMWTDGRAIGSYGSHFIIALKIGSNRFLCCTENYSCTTSKHQKLVLNEISQRDVTYCSQKEIQRAYVYPDEPIIITKIKDSDELSYAWDVLRKHWYKDYLIHSPFPKKKIESFFERLIIQARELEAKRRLGVIRTKDPLQEPFGDDEFYEFIIRINSQKKIEALTKHNKQGRSIKNVLNNYYECQDSSTTLTEQALEDLKAKIFIEELRKNK